MLCITLSMSIEVRCTRAQADSRARNLPPTQREY
ncbi:MAG: hypothetical protein ACI9DC_002906 [Gammaproteobacteria bacterium]|jgi:hypothetical protein